MERYIFSGNLTQKMCDYLKAISDFKPIDALVSQLDRSSVKAAIEHIEKDGVIKSLFIDSGAYSQYTGKCGKIDIDEYVKIIIEEKKKRAKQEGRIVNPLVDNILEK